MERADAVPVSPVPAPVNCVLAVTVVPVIAAAVVAPTVVSLIVPPLIVPPVIATALAFWVDIVPSPETAVFAIAIEVLVTDVTWPDALVTNTGTLDAAP
jgi:hypothetical protein